MHRLMRLSARALRGSSLVLAAAAACLALAGGSSAAASSGGGETSFDGSGTVLVRRGDGSPAELVIRNFSTSGFSVRWASNAIPVAFCTIQANRPSTVSAEQFRGAVRAAAEMWNNIEAAVGVRYVGDCLSQRVDFDDNVNEIGWDDARNLVSGTQAGVTQGSWFTTLGRRDFVEADVVLDSRLSVPEVCMRTVVAHEMGHAIGFGHSDSRADLMYPSFTSSDLSTCRPTASDEEAQWLANLYGPNRRPSVTPPGDRMVQAGAPVILSVLAADPEGDAMTFAWSQVSGTPTALNGNGNTVSLTAPASGTVTLEVSAFDRYLHRSTARVTLTATDQAPDAVPGPPSLQSILANRSRTASTLKWSLVDGAQSHEFCVTLGATATCTAQATPSADVGWATSLSSGGQADERTVLALDMRTTGMRACNTRGCSTAGIGPLMGGFRWTNWGVSYDVVAMALDVAGTPLRFTIGGAVNLGDSPRRFAVYTGPEDDPQRTLVRDCGILDPGQSCIGFLGSGDNGHGELVVVASSAPGTPEAVHRVRVR
ncbi:MAG: matrixin family metalloprotease [Dehalococcoidia bacterium]|nr:MAG: matrixin family metalloprotease [Dehalococcoidia bacterium]